MTHTKNVKVVRTLVAELEPKSESRLDLVEQFEEMQQRIAVRRKEKMILCALLTLFIGVPVVVLSMQSIMMNSTQRESVSHIFH